jgi:hypothetical protein
MNFKLIQQALVALEMYREYTPEGNGVAEQAIVALKQFKKEWQETEVPYVVVECNCSSKTTLYAPPQQKQEQSDFVSTDVEWLARRTESAYKAGYDTGYMDASVKAHDTHPQPKPEGQHALEQALTRLQKRYSELEAKVAAQSNQCANFAQSEWVGLTDEEREELMENYDVASPDYAYAIEAKLKEKNT